MIRIAIALDTFYRLQAFTQQGFRAECKVYADHADIEVDPEVMLYLVENMIPTDTLDDVILRGMTERFRQDA